MRHKWIVSILVLVLASAVYGAKAEEPKTIACLTNLKGTIVTIRAGISVKPLTQYHLRLKDRIQVSAQSSVEVTHYDAGKRYRLEGANGFVVEMDRIVFAPQGKPKPGAKANKEATIIGRFDKKVGSKANGLGTGLSRKILGARARGGLSRLNTPLPFGAIETEERVTFQWQNSLKEPAEGEVPKLEFALYKEDGTTPLFLEELPLLSTSFTLSRNKFALAQNTLYRWEVGVNAPSIGFHKLEAPLWLLTANEKSEIEELVKETDKVRESAKESTLPDLLLTKGYLRVGLFTKAMEHLKVLLEQDGENEEFKELDATLRGLLLIPLPKQEKK